MSPGHQSWRETQVPAQGASPAPRAQQSGGYRRWQYRPAHTGTHPQGRANAYSSQNWRSSPEQLPAAPSRPRESSSPECSLLLNLPRSSGFIYSGPKRAVRPKHPQVEMGRVYSLPSLEWSSSARQASKELRRQPHVNDRAGDHPTLVWDLYEREEDKVQVARCLQVTSFNINGVHRTIEAKYPSPRGDAWKFQCQYLPIQHYRDTTSSTNQPILRLLDDRNMSYQSYVHLDHFFEIEAHLLQLIGAKPLVLDFDSLNVVLTKLRQFVTGCIWHPTYTEGGRVPKSPLDTHLGQCGFPNDLSEALNDRELLGCAVESMRTEWGRIPVATGFEPHRPY